MTQVDLTTMAVQVTIRFPAEAGAVWDLLTDVERMAGLGPEHIAARWLTPGPAVGARFEGRNRIGDREWDVICLVTESRPPEFIEWNVGDGPLPSSTWSYTLTPDHGGSTLVTQQFRHGPARHAVSRDDRVAHERAIPTLVLIVTHANPSLGLDVIA